MLPLRCPLQVAAPTVRPPLPTTAVATAAWAPRSLWPPTILVPCRRDPAPVLVQSAWLPPRQSKLQPRSEPSHPHSVAVCALMYDRCVCARAQMKDGRRTSSLKASYEAIKNNDFQLGREFTLSRDGGGSGGGSGGGGGGSSSSGGYSSSALASTLTQTLTPSTTSDSRGRKSK